MLPDARWFRIVLVVARREFGTRARSRVYLAGTGVMLLLTAGYIVLQAQVFSKSTTSFDVGFAGAAQTLVQPVQAAAKSLRYTIHATLLDDSRGEAEVRDGKLDALLSGPATSPTLTVKDKIDPQLEAALAPTVRQVALAQALAAHGVSVSSLDAALAGTGLQVRTLDPGAARRTERQVAGIVVAILLYVSLLIYGQVVAAGVVEEKANRIVEIILSTIRARQLLLGKVLGIGLAGLIQLALIGAVGLLVAGRTQVISVPTIGAAAVGGGLLWFVLGFVFYALLYASAASLVSRQEDLASVTAPLSVLVVGTYLAFFWVISNPESPGAVVLSLLPPFAPILMPARMATGDAQAWQVVAAVVLAVGAIAAINALGARIYASSVLRTGARVSLRQAWSGRD